MLLGDGYWKELQSAATKEFTCGYCNRLVASDKGYNFGARIDGGGNQVAGLYICPNCKSPNLLTASGRQYPGAPFGNAVAKVPPDLNALYEEARRCTSQNCYTAAVLLCRKMLMNIAVQEGAKEGKRFVEYVSYLSDSGYIPPNGRNLSSCLRRLRFAFTEQPPLSPAG